MTNAFDSVNYPETEPDVLVIGDRWTWKRTDLTDYPPASYTLSYEAVQQAASALARISITATGSGSDHLVQVASTTTDDYSAGTYAWAAYITRASDSARIKIGSGSWRIDADFATSEEDPRTFAQQQVDRLEAVLAKLSERQHESYSVGGRQAALRQLADTRRELNHWRWVRAGEINSERVRRGHRSTNTARARFR